MWKKYIKEYAWCVCLGAGTDIISGYGLGDPEWWCFVIPMIILVQLSKK